MARSKQDKDSAGTSDDLAQAGVPYQKVLMKAFDKLTFEIFIFLLAYVILLIGLGTLAPDLSSTLHWLLYVIPILGVIAYVWSKRASLIKTAEDHGVDLFSGIATGSAEVTGLRGKVTGWLGQIKVWSGYAGDHAQVRAVDVGSSDELSAEDQYLLQLFHQLGDAERGELVSRANGLLKRKTRD